MNKCHPNKFNKNKQISSTCLTTCVFLGGNWLKRIERINKLFNWWKHFINYLPSNFLISWTLQLPKTISSKTISPPCFSSKGDTLPPPGKPQETYFSGIQLSKSKPIKQRWGIWKPYESFLNYKTSYIIHMLYIYSQSCVVMYDNK